VPRLVTTLAVALVLVGAVAPSAGAQALPRGFFGVTANGPLDSLSAGLGDELGVMARAGVSSVRVPVEWAQVQPYARFADVPPAERSRFADGGDGIPSDFGATDARVLGSARRGMSVLALVLRAPGWAAHDPGHPQPSPRDPGQYARFLRLLIARYGPGGTLWARNPGVAPIPVRAWQIWNEPSIGKYFSQQPYVRPYARLLKASYSAVHVVDPGATVVMAGLANFTKRGGLGESLSWRELSKLYRAGIKGHFDAVAVHPFSGRPSNSVKITRLNREVMNRNGDRRKPLWLTEITWSSAKGRKPTVAGWETTEAGQALRLRQAYTLFARERRRLNLQRIYWYTWATTDRDSPSSFAWSGLRRAGPDGRFADKPALRTFRALARAGAR
jgi:hypothetical protein